MALKLFELEAVVGLDDSAYRNAIQDVQSSTKKAVASLSAEYNKAAKAVAELTQKYNNSVSTTGKTSQETKELKTQLAAAQAQLKATTSALKSADTNMADFASSITKTATAAKTTSESVDGMTQKFASAAVKAQVLTSAVIGIAEKLVSVGTNMVSAGIQYNMQMEKYQTAFTNMLGSATEAASTLQKIKEDAARTPLDVASLVQANQLLISAGVDAESARKTVLALGDAVSAAGGGNAELSRMAQNLQQVKNVGKAASIDIKQFAYAGIDIYGILSDYTGKSTAEVQSMTISYDLLTAALQKASEEGGRYYNAMETQSQTLSGRLETLKDNWSQLLGTVTESLSSFAGNLVSSAAKWVEALQTAFEKDGAYGLLEAGGKIVDEVANGIADNVPSLGEKATSAVQAFSGYIQDNASAIVETGGKLLTSLATGIADNLPEMVDAGAQAVSSVLTEITNHFSEVLTHGKEIAEKIAAGISNSLSSVANAAADVVDAITDSIFSTNWVQVGADIIAGIKQGFNWENTKQNLWDAAAKIALNDSDYEEYVRTGGMDYDTSTGVTAKKKRYSHRSYTGHANDPNYEWDENDGWVPKSDTGSTGGNSGGGGNGTGGTTPTTPTKSTGSKTETVIASVSSTVSTTAQNALGNVTTSITTLQEQVKDASGNIKDRVTTTTTETGKEMVNGVETTYKTIETKVDGHVTKTVKTYDDMSKVLTSTATKTATKTVQGVTTAINEVTEKYADGSEHIKKTETKTEEVIVDGVAQTVKTITTYIDDIPDKVQTVTEDVERTVLASQNRIEQYQSELGQELNKGIFGLGRSLISNLQNQNWSGVAGNVVNLIFGEVNQKQRETISKWLKDAALAVNEEYAGGGLQAGLKAIADAFENGITPAVDKSYQKVDSLMNLLKQLSAMETNGGLFTKILGIVGGGTGAAAGAAGAAGSAAGTSAIVSNVSSMASNIIGILGSIVSFVVSNPILAAILGVVAVVGGIGISSALSKKKSSSTTSDSNAASEVSSGLSYKDIQDAYWYGNERAFAGYDFRTDPYTFNPHNSFMNQYQEKMQSQLTKLTEVVEQYLPDVANTQLVLDDGTLVGAMAPGINDQLGHLQLLAERGN